MPHKIVFELDPASADVNVLEEGIVQESVLKHGHEDIERFAFFIRDDDNIILGGCDGEIWCGCLYVRRLWVSEDLRGNGYGAKLMLSAENLANEKGCAFATAHTRDLDALSFYKTLGYYVEFERPGYSQDSILYFLRRDLAGK